MPSLVVNVLMVRFPLVGLEGVEAFACSKVAAIVAACRLAAAAIPALPIRNRRRDGEGGAGGAVAELSRVAGLMVDLIGSSLETKRSRRLSLWQRNFRAERLAIGGQNGMAV